MGRIFIDKHTYTQNQTIMKDNFNLTGWVRNKKMLTENIEEEIGDDMNESNSKSKPKSKIETVEICDGEAPDESQLKQIQNLNLTYEITEQGFKVFGDGKDISEFIEYYFEDDDWGDGGEMNENQADWERFYEEGYLAGYAACQRGVPNRFAGGDEDMPASDYSRRRNSEKY
jgi:hypothetical protein